jgi:signal transduction histidine kinase
MNGSDSQNNDNKKSDEWKSWSPEDFLSNLTHELRTPLMGISGYVEILSNETRKELHPRALENISTYIERLEVVINDNAEYRHELVKRNSTK